MSKIIENAFKYCVINKYRFTEPRKKVLEIILEQNKKIGAYDILKQLSHERNINPPTVYRSIEFWLKHGFIHRIESLNSYIVCNNNHDHKGTQIVICDKCGITKEVCIEESIISKKINKLEDFKVETWNMEIHGLCAHCK